MRTRAEKTLVLVGIIVLGFNLRPAAVSVGPLLEEIRTGLGMSGAAAGLLTSLPVLAFAGFGAAAPALGRRIGVHRITLISLVAVVLGLLGRSLVGSVPSFLALSLLALGGMATANVLMPSLVKLHFPDRIGQMTAIYSTSLAIGLTGASVLSVPIADVAGGWRPGLAAWGITALIAALPWVLLIREDRRTDSAATSSTISLGRIARTRLGWLMAMFFGLQSLQAYAVFGWFASVYRDAGFSASTAGLLLGLITGVSIPLSFLVPSLAGRMTNLAPLMWGLIICYPLGYGGLMLAPAGGAVLWAILVGIALSVFPLALTLIGLRARTPEGTAALSAFTQSVGYLVSVVGPFGFGVLFDLTGGWNASLIGLTALSVPLLFVGLALSRPAYVEDELDQNSRKPPTRGTAGALG
ncbi:CynX/NimT family MFS transporter [Nocardioides salsibiostraticola]